MKAEISIGKKAAVMTLIPEGAADEETIRQFIKIADDGAQINCRGVSYMHAPVEFYVQPEGRSD